MVNFRNFWKKEFTYQGLQDIDVHLLLVSEIGYPLLIFFCLRFFFLSEEISQLGESDLEVEFIGYGF